MSSHPYLPHHEAPVGLLVARLILIAVLFTLLVLMAVSKPDAAPTPPTTYVTGDGDNVRVLP